MASRDKKEERLEARCPAEVKRRIEYAAEIQGRSVTDFLVAAADGQACEVIEKYQVTRLSVEQSLQFADAIINPPKPNAKALSAARRYKKLTGK